MENSYLIFFPNIEFVKGATRSLVYDIPRGSLQFIPNDLYDFRLKYNKKEVRMIYSENPNDKEIIKEYIDFLIQKEYAFIGSFDDTNLIEDSFSKSYKTTNFINHAIIEYSNFNLENLNKILFELESVGCNVVQVISYKQKIDIDKLESFVENISKSAYITNIEFVIPYEKSITKESLDKLFRMNLKIDKVVVHNSPINDTVDYLNGSTLIFNTKKIKSSKSCGIISKEYFSLNTLQYTESHKYNSCLHQKVSINMEGKIQNCPALKESYGNIETSSLKEIVSNQKFQRLWNIHKDKIETCKICEFRHVCTDCRAFIEAPDNLYSKPLKCGYDPKTNKWSDWSQNPLKQSVIQFYGLNQS